jgi:hypothetical protein
MLDSTLTPDGVMPALHYKTGTFTWRYSSQVWCVFIRYVQAGLFIGSQGQSCGKNWARGGATEGSIGHLVWLAGRPSLGADRPLFLGFLGVNRPLFLWRT